MTYEPADAVAFRVRLLTNPGERQDVDYKASIAFSNDDSFSLNLVRHIQGMANAGGGWLVIGFIETDDNGLIPDPTHTNTICSSYDPTPVSQIVDSTLARSQRIRFNIYLEVNPTTGLQHPIIRVFGFERLPYICRSDRSASDNGQLVLRQGVVYFRRPGAETAPISTPQDWEDLINLCVRLRRDDFLNEFRELFERMLSEPQTPPQPAEQGLSDWISQMRTRRSINPEEG
ncbi:hypothetical protein ACFLXK_06455 [Chloroflexota bacterium]